MIRSGFSSSAVCEHLSCRVPVVLAGMGGVSRSELVAAVTEAGGFGFLGMVREPAALILREVESLRQRGYRDFGINIIPAATDPALLERQIETIIELHVPAVALFWDIDERVVARFRDAGITVVYQVGSVAEAIAAERAGAEIIIAQGVEAGGHVRGVQPLGPLLSDIVATVRVPVLAAGGLATGGDLVTALALGAGGIVLGTALLATNESFAHDYHKQRLLAAGGHDTVLTGAFHINWPPGAPVRTLRSDATQLGPAASAARREVIGEEAGRPIYRHSTDSPLRSMTGDFAAMALYAGTAVGEIGSIAPAGQRIAALLAEAERRLEPADADEVAEAASPVCYAGEFSGAYTGTLDADELSAELQSVAADLRALLRASLKREPNATPAFSARNRDYGAWALAIGKLAGVGPVAEATTASLLERLSRLVPRLPEGRSRHLLARLRGVLEAESAIQFTRTLQPTGNRAASSR